MKFFIKNVINIICLICVMPFYLFYKFESLCIQTDQPFQGMSQLFSLFPGISGNYLRRAFCFLAFKKCSLNCCISFGTVFSSDQVEIGENVYIGLNCTLGKVILHDDVLLGSNVDIINGGKQHKFDELTTPIRQQGGEFPTVSIGEDTWIGNGALVMSNVGKKCIVGAHAVVIEEVAAYTIAVGNPARVVKQRKPSLHNRGYE